jgi:hypothetical protein
MRKFNTEGPIQADIHYCIPPISRIDTGHLMELIDDRRYFVLHAPRQTGKTSCLMALVDELNRGGRYKAVYVNVEAAQAYRHDVNGAVRTVLSHLAISAEQTLGDDYPQRARSRALADDGGGGALYSVLSGWAKSSPKPIVLVIDEIDAMVGDSLISVLRQLRAGYPNRPGAFPQSVVLCGVRDVRDYRIQGKDEVITGGSAFNIKAESLRLGDFTRADVEKLYAQHTEETGQRFEPAVIDLVWDLTQGQPWLVNALARRACFGIAEGLDRSRPITADLIHQAREAMVVERVTHLDQLADKLKEPRVRSVVEPIVEGTQRTVAEASDDTQYVVDLGLVRRGPQGLEIANRIYAEVIPRELSYEVQTDLLAEETPPYLGPGNRLRMDWLLEGFQQFFRENSEAWVERFTYKESGPHLLLQA